MNHHQPFKKSVFSAGFIVLFLFSLFFVLNFSKDIQSLFGSKQASAQITTGLVGYWNFDEGAGLAASDSSGNNNTGTLTNGPVWTTGKIGQALSFDGVNDYARILTNSTLKPATELTLSVWIKPNTLNSDRRTIIAKSGLDSGGGYLLNAKEYGSASASFGINPDSSGGGQTLLSTGALTLRAWTHIVATYQSGGQMRIYFNGVLNNSAAATQSSINYTFDPDLYIGDFLPQRPGSNIDGLIDDVRIYNRALSAAEVTELYNYTGTSLPDSVPPVLSAGSPTGTLAANTTQTTLSLTTDENSTCKYGTIPNTAYASITNTFTTMGGLSHSSTIPGLTNGISYNYYVRCQDTSSNANTTDYTISFSVSNPAPTDTTAPTTPTNLTATAISSSQINLSWTASTDDLGVTGYKIYRCAGSGCAPTVQIATSPTNSYSDTGLTASTAYTYTISAYDAAGNESRQSASVSATTQAQNASKTYYVSPTGVAIWANCSGSTPLNGTAACSAKTAFTNAIAGDIVYFRGGTYNVPAKNFSTTYHGYYEPANSGTAANSITFKAYAGETPLFNGTIGGSGDTPDYATIFGTNGKDYLTFDGFSLQANNGTGMARMILGGDSGNFSQYVTIQNSRFNGGTTALTTQDNREGLRVEQASYGTIANNIFYNYKYAADAYIGVGAIKSYISDHITVEHNEIYNSTHGIYNKSYGDNWILRYNYIHDTYLGINISTNSHYQTNGKIYHNIITGFGFAGIWLGATDDNMNNWQVYNNTLYTTLTALEGTLPTSDGGFNSTGWQFYNNIFQGLGSDYSGAGVRYASAATASLIDYNNYGSGMNVLCGSTYTTISGLRGATCSQLASPNHDQRSVAGAPVFTNGSGNLNLVSDYRLSSASPGYLAGNDGKDMGADIANVGTGGASSPTDITPPTTPTNLTATSISSSQINLSWTVSTDNVAVTGYKIYRCAGSACVPTVQIATSTTNSYSNTGLTPSTVYTYAVSAYDSANNESAKSSAVSATTQTPADIIPPVISLISASGTTQTSSDILWTTNEMSTHQVEYGLTSAYGSLTSINSTLMTSHTQSLTALSAGTLYHYRVRSKDASGNEAISTDNSFTTLVSATLDTTAPAQTTDLTANNITQTSVDLMTWTAAGDDGIIGTAASYDIRYATSLITESNWAQAIVVTGEPIPKIAGTKETMTVPGLSPNTIYYFALKTKDAANNVSLLSNVISFTTLVQTVPVPTPTPTPTPAPSGGGGGSFTPAPSGGGYFSDLTPPSPPKDFKAQGADKQINLTWQNPKDNDFVRVLIVKNLNKVPTSVTDGEVIYEGDKQEYTDINLDNTKTYHYAIFAYDKKPNYTNALTLQAKPEAGKVSINVTRTKLIYNLGTVTLRNGSRGEAVKELQKLLNKLLNLNLKEDGKLGPKTIIVIKQWQKDRKLKVDGLVGPKSKMVMKAEGEQILLSSPPL